MYAYVATQRVFKLFSAQKSILFSLTVKMSFDVMYVSGWEYVKLTCNVILRAKRKVFNSTNSNMKLCGKPPSKPSMQSTCKESAD